MWRTEALVSSSEPPVGMTKSARARFSGIGQLAGEDAAIFFRGHARPGEGAGRAAPRAGRRPPRPCRPGRRRLSRTAGECRAPPPARRDGRRGTPRAPAPPRDGSAPRAAASTSGSASTRSASAVAVDASGPGRAREMRLDLGDQRAFRALQPVHDGVGVEHRHAFLGEHAGDGRLAHADRAGEAEDDHRTSKRAQLRVSRRGTAASRRNG